MLLLTVLSTFTLANANSAELVNSLVGSVLATMVGISVYHFHILYTRFGSGSYKTKLLFPLKTVPESAPALTDNSNRIRTKLCYRITGSPTREVFCVNHDKQLKLNYPCEGEDHHSAPSSLLMLLYFLPSLISLWVSCI